MAFRLPDFNSTFSWWAPGLVPVMVAPTLTNIPCQLYLHSRSDTDLAVGSKALYIPTIFLRVESAFVGNVPLVDSFAGIVDPVNAFMLYYRVRWWEWTHLNFPNQYVSILVEQCDGGGIPPDPGR